MAANVWLQRMLPYTHVTYRSPKSAHFSVFLNYIRCIKAQKLKLSEKLRERRNIFFAVRVSQRDRADAQFVKLF